MSLDDIIQVNLSAASTPVTTALTTVPMLVAHDQPTWADDKACHAYSSVADMLSDGFKADSPTVAYARLLTGQGNVPSTFYVGRKAGDDLAASDLDAIVAQDNSWYGFTVVQGSDEDIHTAAAWALAQKKLQVAASATASNADASSTGSLAAVLASESQRRTALMFSPASASKGIDAAWLGGQLPALPGSNNWGYVTLDGVATDSLTAGQLRAVIGNAVSATRGNNANAYINRAGTGSTQYGTTSSGEWIDNVIGEDWIVFNLQSALFSVLKNNAKVPFTDRGVNLLIAACHSVMDQGVVNGLISTDKPYTVKAPAVSSVSQQDKIARVSPAISIECVLAGAINSIRINVNVTL